MVQVEMTNTQPPNVLKKPIGTKRIIATATTTTTSSSTPSTLVIDSKRMKYDDNKIAERVPIEELRQGLYKLPEWAEGLFDITPEGQPRRRRRLTHLTNEEKVLRRKLKNRVAAQNARDKKRDESERIKIENEQLQAVVAQMQSDAGNRESEIERLRRENAQLRARLGLSPPPEEAIILIQSQSNDKFDDSGIHSPLSETHSGSPPAASVV